MDGIEHDLILQYHILKSHENDRASKNRYKERSKGLTIKRMRILPKRAEPGARTSAEAEARRYLQKLLKWLADSWIQELQSNVQQAPGIRINCKEILASLPIWGSFIDDVWAVNEVSKDAADEVGPAWLDRVDDAWAQVGVAMHGAEAIWDGHHSARRPAN